MKIYVLTRNGLTHVTTKKVEAKNMLLKGWDLQVWKDGQVVKDISHSYLMNYARSKLENEILQVADELATKFMR